MGTFGLPEGSNYHRDTPKKSLFPCDDGAEGACHRHNVPVLKTPATDEPRRFFPPRQKHEAAWPYTSMVISTQSPEIFWPEPVTQPRLTVVGGSRSFCSDDWASGECAGSTVARYPGISAPMANSSLHRRVPGSVPNGTTISWASKRPYSRRRVSTDSSAT